MTKFNLNKYKTFIFDCDGVILNSNKIKSESFKKVTKNFGERISDQFYNFHLKNGGVSRNEKFKYFVNKLLNIKNDNLVNKLILEYSKNIYDGLLNCEVNDCLKSLKQQYSSIEWFVLTGGNETEVKDIFRKRKILYFKEDNIYGSPKSKYDNFKILTNNDLIKYPAIFFGDSEYDYNFSFDNNIDFIFVSNWTEFKNWNSFCMKNNIKTIKDICELI